MARHSVSRRPNHFGRISDDVQLGLGKNRENQDNAIACARIFRDWYNSNYSNTIFRAVIFGNEEISIIIYRNYLRCVTFR